MDAIGLMEMYSFSFMAHTISDMLHALSRRAYMVFRVVLTMFSPKAC